MKGLQTGMQWITVMGVCTVLCGLVADPRGLPECLSRPIGSAVDGAARAWLWIWDEPDAVQDISPVEKPARSGKNSPMYPSMTSSVLI